MLLKDYSDWLPFQDAVALLGTSAGTFKVYVHKKRIEKIKNPLARGRYLYGKTSILKLKATKRPYVKRQQN